MGNYSIKNGKGIIAKGLKSIADNAFSNCTELIEINIPDRVKYIGNYAFSGCSNLISINIPKTIEMIGWNQHDYYWGDEDIPYIGEGAFLNCSSLEKIIIPESVNSILNNAFEGCIMLRKIKVDVNNKTYDSRDDCNAIIETGTNRLILGCLSTIIPNTVTEIADFAFRDCNGLKSITIPESVVKINRSAFNGCSGLSSINVPVEKIDYYKLILPQELHDKIVGFAS